MTFLIAADKYKKRTLARDLIIRLTLAISFVVTILVIIYYAYSTITSRRELNARIAYITDEFAKVLALPMWNVDENMIQQISEAYLKSEYLSGIRVENNFKEILFEKLHGNGKNLVIKQQSIQTGAYYLGRVELMFNRKSIEQTRKKVLIATVVINISVIIIIIAGTHFIMKSFLNKPLDQLIQSVRSIAGGDYQTPLVPVPQSDINSIVSEVNIMADKIATRTEQLEHLNKALAESEKKFRNLFESAPDGISITTLEGKILSFNDAFIKIFKAAGKEAYSPVTTEKLYANPEDRSELMKKLMKQRQLENYELNLVDISGKSFPASVSLRLIQYEGQTCTLAIVRDIARIKKMEDELRNYTENLEKMVDEKTRELQSANEELASTVKSLEQTREQLASNAHQAGMAEIAVSVLHNIGNTVTPVNTRLSRLENNSGSRETESVGKIYDLLKKEQTAPEIREQREKLLSYISATIEIMKNKNRGFETDLRVIRKGMDHIMEIIAIQQKYAGLQGFESLVSINDLMMDAVEMLTDSIEKRSVSLEFSLDKLPHLHLDRNKMIQIFINIIKNAYESIDMAHPENRKQIHLGTLLKKEEKYVQAVVADTGAGLSPELTKDVFRFNFSTKGRGSFGLHDSANYIKARGGSIELISQGPGHGAQLIIKLPLESERSERSEK
ncbi:MAG: PAS domain S-box protein [Desulfobacteraceae bacterium]|nr:PAS domain S-box protein [Desulfobacteraceae bacterium]